MKRKVRIEEITVSWKDDFSKDVWIESETFEYAETVNHNNEGWIVVEVQEGAE